MKTTKENTPKRTYSSPLIEQIKLDNEISLALESNPPMFELVKGSNAPEYFNNDPFKTNVG
ncbi:MAG: hypothetical protein PHR83_10510 [Paludibacter sp.]|nr:hypothetical protein [Paludibacter sp.]